MDSPYEAAAVKLGSVRKICTAGVKLGGPRGLGAGRAASPAAAGGLSRR